MSEFPNSPIKDQMARAIEAQKEDLARERTSKESVEAAERERVARTREIENRLAQRMRLDAIDASSFLSSKGFRPEDRPIGKTMKSAKGQGLRGALRKNQTPGWVPVFKPYWIIAKHAYVSWVSSYNGEMREKKSVKLDLFGLKVDGSLLVLRDEGLQFGRDVVELGLATDSQLTSLGVVQLHPEVSDELEDQPLLHLWRDQLTSLGLSLSTGTDHQPLRKETILTSFEAEAMRRERTRQSLHPRVERRR